MFRLIFTVNIHNIFLWLTPVWRRLRRWSMTSWIMLLSTPAHASIRRCETARYRSLNMYPHRQISVDVNTQMTDKQRWGDRNASDQYHRRPCQWPRVLEFLSDLERRESRSPILGFNLRVCSIAFAKKLFWGSLTVARGSSPQSPRRRVFIIFLVYCILSFVLFPGPT